MRMKQSDRLSQVEALLGPELTAKHREAVEYGVKARLSPKTIAKAVLRSEEAMNILARVKEEAKDVRPFRDPGGSDIQGDGWSIVDDWGVSFLYRGERPGSLFCRPKRDELAHELRGLAQAATEAADALDGNR